MAAEEEPQLSELWELRPQGSAQRLEEVPEPLFASAEPLVAASVASVEQNAHGAWPSLGASRSRGRGRSRR